MTSSPLTPSSFQAIREPMAWRGQDSSEDPAPAAAPTLFAVVYSAPPKVVYATVRLLRKSSQPRVLHPPLVYASNYGKIVVN